MSAVVCPMRFVLLSICFLAPAASALAGLAPESVLLVVNGDSQSSLTVANEYAHQRQIPENNIVVLTGITNVEQLQVEEFRQQILGPVLQAIQRRGLQSQIRCVAYSADFPTAIHVNVDIGDRKLAQVLTPVASINGLTFLHQLTMAKDVRYLDLNANLYARKSGARSSDSPWQADELRRYATALQRLNLEARRPRSASNAAQPADASLPANDASLREAFDSLIQLRMAHPKSPELLYNVACALATADRHDEALVTLKAAVTAGWFDHRHTTRDPDLDSVRDREDFKALLNEMKSVKLDVQPARGFRSDVGWQPNGEPSTNSEQPRYLLSTVLGVTAGRGLKTSEVIENLRRSATADGTRPTGTIYFERNGDIRSTTREWGFASAVEKLNALGVEAVVEDGVLPQKKQNVAGAVIGIADFDWPKSESTILPGAIVEHLTSFGGIMTKGAGQTPLTEFLRHGAAGSSGTVTEPYAIQAKFPSPFIHVHYASGATLAESFYLSVSGPYQLLVVGDPLCSPWRREIDMKLECPSTEKPWQGKVTLTAKPTLATGTSIPELIWFVDGRQHGSGTTLELETQKLTEGDHQLVALGFADDALETMSRRTVNFSVRNGDAEQPKLECRSPGEHPIDKPLEIEAAWPGATEMFIQHLGRDVAKVAGDSGTATLQTKQLGSGPIALRLSATVDGTTVLGPRLIVTIQKPAD